MLIEPLTEHPRSDQGGLPAGGHAQKRPAWGQASGSRAQGRQGPHQGRCGVTGTSHASPYLLFMPIQSLSEPFIWTSEMPPYPAARCAGSGARQGGASPRVGLPLPAGWVHAHHLAAQQQHLRHREPALRGEKCLPASKLEVLTAQACDRPGALRQ